MPAPANELTSEAFSRFLVAVATAVAASEPEFRRIFYQVLDQIIELGLSEIQGVDHAALAKCYRMLLQRIETASKAADGSLFH